MPCMSVTAHKTATALGKNVSATQGLVPAGKQHPTSLSTSELLLQPCQLLIVVSNNTSRTAGSISLQYKTLRQFHIINFPPMLSFHSGLLFCFVFSPLEFITGHLNFAKIATNFNKRESQSFQQQHTLLIFVEKDWKRITQICAHTCMLFRTTLTPVSKKHKDDAYKTTTS